MSYITSQIWYGMIISHFVRFEILTVVLMNAVIIWDIASCSLYLNHHFGGTYCLPLQG